MSDTNSSITWVGAEIAPLLPARIPPSSRGGLETTILQLLAKCRENSWAGWDPYDGLKSPVFTRLPFLRNYFCRLAFIQFCKRSPLNLRPLFRVPRQPNPKAIALFVSSLVRLAGLGLAELHEATHLARVLLDLQSKDSGGACWGYDFDWQCRDGFVPKWEPNIICTSFAGNALLDLYEVNRQQELLSAALDAGRFIVDILHRSNPDGSVWLTYTPRSTEAVHNANLLGAAFLARLSLLDGASCWGQVAAMATRFSVARQREDGSWLYGEGRYQSWIDSFHTGYNLVALDRIRRSLRDDSLEACIRQGLSYFVLNFITPKSVVKYYHNRIHPIDTHCIAQAIITLVELRRFDSEAFQRADGVLQWALGNMRSRDGWFYYQKSALFTNRIPYMRWTQAWMLLAMVEFAVAGRPLAYGPKEEHRVS